MPGVSSVCEALFVPITARVISEASGYYVPKCITIMHFYAVYMGSHLTLPKITARVIEEIRTRRSSVSNPLESAEKHKQGP